MPIVFIHGVNTRESPGYLKAVAARDELIRRYIAEPLARRGEPLAQLTIVNPYWGKPGVRPSLGAGLPARRPTLEGLGGEEEGTPQADLEFAAMISDLAEEPEEDAGLESLGGEAGQLRHAAEADLSRFLEAVLARLLMTSAN